VLVGFSSLSGWRSRSCSWFATEESFVPRLQLCAGVFAQLQSSKGEGWPLSILEEFELNADSSAANMGSATEMLSLVLTLLEAEL
jgi:hypothetical protein